MYDIYIWMNEQESQRTSEGVQVALKSRAKSFI
jgi:hypothetical protein